MFDFITIPDSKDWHLPNDDFSFSASSLRDKYGNILKIWLNDKLIYERDNFMSIRFVRRN